MSTKPPFWISEPFLLVLPGVLHSVQRGPHSHFCLMSLLQTSWYHHRPALQGLSSVPINGRFRSRTRLLTSGPSRPLPAGCHAGLSNEMFPPPREYILTAPEGDQGTSTSVEATVTPASVEAAHDYRPRPIATIPCYHTMLLYYSVYKLRPS